MILAHKQTTTIERTKSLFCSVADLAPNQRNLHYIEARNEIVHLTRVLRKAFTMPKRKATSNRRAFTFNGYVNVSVPETMTKDLESKIVQSAWIFSQMAQAISDGYNLKVYHDAEGGHYRASFTCFDPESENHGYMLSAFASDWYTAVGVLLYKHFDVAGEDWNSWKQSNDRPYG